MLLNIDCSSIQLLFLLRNLTSTSFTLKIPLVMSSFNNDIHFLATTRHIKEIPSSTFKIYDVNEVENMRLLNDIALLLVVKPKEDVCAVALRFTNQHIEFLYTKNTPCGKFLESYLSSVKTILVAILAATPLENKRKKLGNDLLRLVCQTCIEKVQARLLKAQQELSEYTMLCSPSNLSPKTTSLRRHRSVWANMEDTEIIAAVLSEIRDLDPSLLNLKNHIESLMSLIMGAYGIGNIAFAIA